MKIASVMPVVVSSDRDAAVRSFTALLGSPTSELPVPSAQLTVTTFPGLSLLSGAADAVSPVRQLRATFFVASLIELEVLLNRFAWPRVGSLGETSLLARDPDGNLFEFVEQMDA
jgi:hypothetical protein